MALGERDPYTGPVAIGIDASRAFLEEPTGIGVYSTQVISGLILDQPAPMVLYLNAARPPRGAPGLGPDSRWRPLPLRRGWTRMRLAREIHRRPPELLFVPAYRLPPGPIPSSVVTVHGVEHRLAPEAYPGAAGRAVDDFVRDSLARASRIITPSETTKADLVQHYSADPGRITAIAHGVSPLFRVREALEVSSVSSRLGVRTPYLLAVGAHHPRKNIPFLLRAFAAAFPPGTPGPELVVTNAAAAAAKALRRLSLELGIQAKVLPHVGGDDLACLYTGALAACIPSLYEGFGLPALEAMACGTPVVANQAGGVEEVATGAALLISENREEEWVEALRSLVGQSDLRQHLAALGLRRSAGFTWERSVAAHRRVLLEELSTSRLGHRR